MKVELDIRKSVFENAETYFQKAKKLRSKLKGAQAALSRLESKPPEKPKPPRPQPKLKTRLRWYEKFRYFRTSGNLLVVAGKDAATNELLLKKHVEPHDIVFHADVTGAAFAVIKTEGKPVPEKSLIEAAEFSASYSKAWKGGFASIDVYWVRPDQVSKTPPSGEYLEKGAFIISGKKNYLRNTRLQLAIGNSDGNLVWGALSSVRSLTKDYVVILPGNVKSSDLARKIKGIISLNIGISEIQRLIPAGKGKIQKQNS